MFHDFITTDELSRCGGGGILWACFFSFGIALPPILNVLCVCVFFFWFHVFGISYFAISQQTKKKNKSKQTKIMHTVELCNRLGLNIWKTMLPEMLSQAKKLWVWQSQVIRTKQNQTKTRKNISAQPKQANKQIQRVKHRTQCRFWRGKHINDSCDWWRWLHCQRRKIFYNVGDESYSYFVKHIL